MIALQHIAERSGAVVEVVPADSEGRIILESLEQMVSTKPPALVAMTHAAAHSGSVNPVCEIGRVAKEVGSFYLIDACQSIGQLPISVEKLKCDALTATGRKWLRGPRGTGFLFVKKGVSDAIDPATSDSTAADYLFARDDLSGSQVKIRADARKFELWERSIAGAIGLGLALEYLLNLTLHSVEIYDRILELAQYAADQLRALDGVEVWAPDRAESGVVGFVVRNYGPIAVKAACSLRGINISTMSAFNSPLVFSVG